MKKITDYQIVTAEETSDLTLKVKEEMNYGWQPLGGFVNTSWNEGSEVFMEYSQTLVKYADE